jgi:hypothetical protein
MDVGVDFLQQLVIPVRRRECLRGQIFGPVPLLQLPRPHSGSLPIRAPVQLDWSEDATPMTSLRLQSSWEPPV